MLPVPACSLLAPISAACFLPAFIACQLSLSEPSFNSVFLPLLQSTPTRLSVALACLGERLTGSDTQASPEHILHVPLPASAVPPPLALPATLNKQVGGSLLRLLSAFIHVRLLPASFHSLPAFTFCALFQLYFSAPASVHTHPLVRGLSLSRGETYWLRHSGKPRAYSACTPARFQMYPT